MQADQLLDKSVDVLTATVAISTAISDAVKLYGTTAIGFATPAALTGATFTFTGSMDKGGTFVTIKDRFNATVSYTVTVDTGYPMDADIFAPYDQIKIVMADGNEAAERLIQVKPFAI